MKIKICTNLVHPQEIRYASKSKPGHTYVVITESLFNDDFCSCPGWKFREHCSHVEDARQNFACHWYGKLEEVGEIKICPKCGAEVEDFETDAEWN